MENLISVYSFFTGSKPLCISLMRTSAVCKCLMDWKGIASRNQLAIYKAERKASYLRPSNSNLMLKCLPKPVTRRLLQNLVQTYHTQVHNNGTGGFFVRQVLYRVNMMVNLSTILFYVCDKSVILCFNLSLST